MSENKSVAAWRKKNKLIKDGFVNGIYIDNNQLGDALCREIECLEAENTRLRNAAEIAIEFLSRLDNSTSKHDACMRTLEHALEGK